MGILESLVEHTTRQAHQMLRVVFLFTQQMVQTRGWVSDDEIETFLKAGYTKQQVLEVILGIAVKVIHNYTNHIAQTPLDKAFGRYTWSKPTVYEDVNTLQ